MHDCRLYLIFSPQYMCDLCYHAWLLTVPDIFPTVYVWPLLSCMTVDCTWYFPHSICVTFVIMHDCWLYLIFSPQYMCDLCYHAWLWTVPDIFLAVYVWHLLSCVTVDCIWYFPNSVCLCPLGPFSVLFYLQDFANWSITIFRLLSENPSLLQLYRDLVITHVISSEEFWSQHALQYMQKHHNKKQDIGVSGAFLVCFGLQLAQCFVLLYLINTFTMYV
jgi:hypothetical protein